MYTVINMIRFIANYVSHIFCVFSTSLLSLLSEHQDLLPYLPSVVPGLKQCLLDPVPEVRSVSARALGAMVKGMGESSFEELLPWLMEKLVSENSSVDRSGAAQGNFTLLPGCPCFPFLVCITTHVS